MSRIALLLTFILCISIPASAQYTVKWMKLVKPTGTQGYNFGEDLVVDPTGRVVITGNTDAPQIGAVTISYDTAGTEQWRRFFPGVVDAYGLRLMRTSSGKFVSAGFYEDASGTHNLHYFTYSATGLKLDSGIQSSPGFAVSDDFGDAALDSKGRVYLAGGITYGPNLNASLSRFDSGGVLRFRDTLFTPGFASTYNWSLRVVGDTMLYTLCSSGGYGGILRYDTTGVLRWRRDSLVYPDNNHSRLAVDGAGNAILGGRWTGGFTVVKVKPSGDTAWRRAIPFSGLNTVGGSIHSVATDESGAVYAYGFGNTTAPVGYYSILAKLNASGVLQWVDTFRGSFGAMSGDNQEYMLLQNNRLTVAVSGFNPRLIQYALTGAKLMDTVLSIPGLAAPEINAMQFFNGDLYVTGNSRTGGTFTGFTARLGMPVSPTGVDANAVLHTVQLYPNPVRTQLHIPGFDGAVAEVTDAAGRLCKKGTVRNGVLDVATLQPGVYNLKLTLGKRSNSCRFIKQ